LVGAEVQGLLDELLKLLMAAERRATEADERAQGLDPARFDDGDDVQILCVDGDERLYKALKQLDLRGYHLTYAQSGGEALDRISNQRFQIALVGHAIVDLPPDMVHKALKTQAPETIVLRYVPNGPLELVEPTRRIVLVEKFQNAAQLTGRLGELSQAFRERARERRYLQAFREKHYDLLRRLAEIKQKLGQGG
jgi:DNA-binding NtrC family response regulator